MASEAASKCCSSTPELAIRATSLGAVEVVAGNVTCVASQDLSGSSREPVPDRLAPTVLGEPALDLIGSGGDTPSDVV